MTSNRLCKKLCAKCWNDIGWAWDKNDETLWQEGYIICAVSEYKVTYPPDECPYAIEHLMNEESK